MLALLLSDGDADLEADELADEDGEGLPEGDKLALGLSEADGERDAEPTAAFISIAMPPVSGTVPGIFASTVVSFVAFHSLKIH